MSQYNTIDLGSNDVVSIVRNTRSLSHRIGDTRRILQYLQVPDASLYCRGSPINTLILCIALCHVRANYCRDSWKIMKTLLATNLKHSSELLIVRKILNDALFRSAVRHINMVLWGSALPKLRCLSSNVLKRSRKLHFDQLPNECLIMILSNLDVCDLTSVADCASRYCSLARHVFWQRYRTGKELRWDLVPYRTLIRFGDLIRNLRLPLEGSITEEELRFINRRMTKLVKLHIPIDKHNGRHSPALQQLIPRLTILTLQWIECEFDYSKMNWHNIVVLQLACYYIVMDEIFKVLQSPSLKYLKLYGSIVNDTAFEKFAQKNVQLKGISLLFKYNTDAIKLTGIKYLKNLEILCISSAIDVFKHQNVNMIMITFVYNELAEVDSLRELYLDRLPYTNSISAIKQLKRLCMRRMVNIVTTPWHVHLQYFANNLPNLEDLFVDLFQCIDRDSLIEFVENASQVKRIYLDCIRYHERLKLIRICENQKRTLEITTYRGNDNTKNQKNLRFVVNENPLSISEEFNTAKQAILKASVTN